MKKISFTFILSLFLAIPTLNASPITDALTQPDIQKRYQAVEAYLSNEENEQQEVSILPPAQSVLILKTPGVQKLLADYLKNGDEVQNTNARSFIQELCKMNFVDWFPGKPNRIIQDILIKDASIVEGLGWNMAPLVQSNPNNQTTLIQNPSYIQKLTHAPREEACIQLATLLGEKYAGISWESEDFQRVPNSIRKPNKNVQKAIISSPAIFGLLKEAVKTPAPNKTSAELSDLFHGTRALGFLVLHNRAAQQKVLNTPTMTDALVTMLSYQLDDFGPSLAISAANTLYYLMSNNPQVRQAMYKKYPKLQEKMSEFYRDNKIK
jgi:hypothetical protein